MATPCAPFPTPPRVVHHMSALHTPVRERSPPPHTPPVTSPHPLPSHHLTPPRPALTPPHTTSPPPHTPSGAPSCAAISIKLGRPTRGPTHAAA